MRTRDSIDFDWKFLLGDEPAATQPAFDDSAWRSLDLPHDWSIEATPHPDNPAHAAGGFFPGGIGWYRKKLDIPADLGDKHVTLEFGGVYMNSEVWCNGHLLGKRPYGYISFAYDITEHVTPGETAVIAVRVDNEKQKNCRWYSGSGIYRHVWMTVAGPVRVGQWGTFVTTPEVTEKKAVVECVVEVVDNGDADVEVAAVVRPWTTASRRQLQDENLQYPTSNFQLPTSKGVTAEGRLRFEVENPKLWSPEAPHLYTLRVELKKDGEVVDTYDTRFGIRTIRFDANEGFFLNGKSTKLMGMNEHHDAGCVGAAVPDDVIRRRFQILRDMGCNAIRVAHNPASPVFLDICDEMGLMVVEDAFDEWKGGKTEFGYGALYWDEWWEKDLVAMIHRDRNHPSVVLWSVGNETKASREGKPEGLPIAEALRDVCHREDPTRPMTCGCCGTRNALPAGYGAIFDVMGYNGGGGGCFDYEKDHETYPDMIMFASEVPHTLQTRGIYHSKTWYRNEDMERIDVPDYTDEDVFPETEPQYLSSFDNALVRISAIDSWRFTKTLPFMCGEFRWTGFDYIGECYSWPAKSWNFGVIDLCGFPKDTYFFYKSQWTSEPMIHLAPHWTWPGLEGKVLPVICYTNCDKAELFLNDESLGVREMGEKLYLRWDAPYAPGTLRAVGYHDGNEVASCSHETAEEATALKLECDVTKLATDRHSIVHVAATLVDDRGRFAPHANHMIKWSIDGPGALLGLENGDPIDTSNYKLDHRKAFNGMALAIIRATAESGNITVTATAEGLPPATCTVQAV